MTAHAWAQSARPDRFGLSSLLPRPGVEGIEQPLHLQIRQRKLIGETAREQRAAIPYGGELADELDPGGGQRVQIQRQTLARADQLRRGQPPRALEILDLIVALVPDPGVSIHQSMSRPR